MTLATLVRNLGLDGAPNGFHASAQNWGIISDSAEMGGLLP